MNRNTAFIAAIITAIIFVLPFFPEEAPVYLSLDEAVAMALEESYGIKTYLNNKEKAEAVYNASVAGYKSKISMLLTVPSYAESTYEVTLSDGKQVFASSTSTSYQASVTGDTTLPTDGTVRLEWNVLDRAQDGWTDQFNNAVRLTLNQPFFTLNERKMNLRNSEISLEASNLGYDRNVCDLIYAVTAKYYAVVKASRRVGIDTERVRQSTQSYERARLKYDAGLIPEVEALELEVGLKQDRAGLESSIASQERSEEDLKQALGIGFNREVIINENVDSKEVRVDLQKTIAYALENMDSLRLRELGKEQSEIAVRRARKTTDFRVDLSAFIEYFGNGVNWDTASDNFRDSRNRGVTMSVSVPIFDSGREKYRVIFALADLRNAELEIEEEKKNIERRVRDAVRNIGEASNRVSILKESSEIAEKSYEISLHRFEAGSITSQMLLDSQLALTNSKTTYLNAVIDYELAVADLKRLLQVDSLGAFSR